MIFVSTDCSFANMKSYCLNSKFVLNLCGDVVLQSTITLIANFWSIKILLHWFLVRLLVHIYVCYDLNDNLMYFFTNLYDLILFLFIFHLITIFHHYLLSFLYQFFHRFSTYINHIYIMYYIEALSYFISSGISLYSFDKLLTRTSSSWLIHGSINPIQDRGAKKASYQFFLSNFRKCRG